MKAVLLLLLLAVPAIALAGPMPPPDLYDSGGVVCLRLADSGKVEGAFIGRSTGDPRKDKRFLAWVNKMTWPAQPSDGTQRDNWFELSLRSKVPAVPPEKVDCPALAVATNAG